MLNQNSGSLSVLFSATVSVATIFYVVLTRQLAAETRKLRKVETDPHVSIYIEPEDRWINLLDLVIKNTGRGPAYDIIFKIEPDFLIDQGKRDYLSKLPFMQKLDYLSPGQSIKFFLANGVDIFNRKDDPSFSINVNYESKDGNKFKEEFKIDFEKFKGMMSVGNPPLYEIAKAITKLAEDVRHIRTGFSKIKADIYTAKDREAEKRTYEAIINENINTQENEKGLHGNEKD